MGLGVRWKPIIGFVLLTGMVLLLSGEHPMLSEPYPSNYAASSASTLPAAPPMGSSSSSAAAAATPADCAPPCQHGGVCVQRQCRCPRGYEGSACEVRLPPPAAACGPPRRAKDADSDGPSRCKPSFLIIGAVRETPFVCTFWFESFQLPRQAWDKRQKALERTAFSHRRASPAPPRCTTTSPPTLACTRRFRSSCSSSTMATRRAVRNTPSRRAILPL